VRAIVYGAGAVGGVVGGRLALAGHRVVLIARGEHGSAIAGGGLAVESPAGSATVDVPVVSSPAEVRWEADDVVMVAVKSQDTVAVLDALAAVAPRTIPVLCLQNGVDNERSTLRRFPFVYPVCVMLPAAHLQPGVVQAYADPVAGLLDLGRYPSGEDERCHQVAEMLGSATFESIVRPDIMRWKYRKLLMNLHNAVEAVCGPGALGGELGRRVNEEGSAVLAAAGIDVASAGEDRARRGSLLRLGPVGGRDRAGGSSWQSLARRTGTVEADYLNGEIVLLGRRLGIATPVNVTLQRLANDLARTGAAPGQSAESDVLRLIGAP
jgi:2-dehydropantoate 2-reductase